MSEFVYVNVNEEGEEYARSFDLESALALLREYPNDAILVKHSDCPYWQTPIHVEAYCGKDWGLASPAHLC